MKLYNTADCHFERSEESLKLKQKYFVVLNMTSEKTKNSDYETLGQRLFDR